MKSDKTELFERMPVPRAVMTMAVPTIISQLIVLIYNMADTYFIGKTNNDVMVAGVSLILPVFNIALSIAGLAGVGGGTLVSRLLGKDRTDEARKVFSFSVYLGGAVSVLFSMIMLIGLNPILTLLGADADVLPYARTYTIFVVIIGALPTVMSNVLSTMLRSVGESGKAGFGITMGGVLNMFLDPLFMFVLLPRGNEILGVGIATLISNIAAALYFVIVISRLKDRSVLKMTSPTALPEKAGIAAVFSVGVPSSVATLLFDLDYIVLDKLMSGYGNSALAALGIVLKVERLPLNVGIGLCQGMMPIIAYNYASGNLKRMNSARRFTCTVGVVFALFSVAAYELLSPQLITLFIKEAETNMLGSYFLRIRCLATPLMFLSFFHVYLFNGFGKGMHALFLGVMRWLAFNIPMLFILEHFFGKEGLVWSQVSADVLTVTLSVALYAVYSKKAGLRSR